jgi:hypothetical protein
MERFKFNQRVRIVSQDGLSEREQLIGKLGTVVRCRYGDNGAWINMDDPLDEKLTSFPARDPRRNHILMYPEECEPV